jgi:hypothetical protein
MAEQVIFHVGLPKAGTTFVQTIMWHNRARLREEQSLLYPGNDRMDHFHASHALRHPDSGSAGAWDRMVGWAREWDGTVMISHEFFSMVSPEQARQAVADLAPAEVTVVVTARDYVRQFPAMWQEFLKIRTDDKLDDYMDKALAREISGAWTWDSQDLPVVLDRWAGAVGDDHVHLVTLPPVGAPRNLLWDRWVEVVGIDDSRLETDVSFGNESLGAPQAALLRAVSPYLTDQLKNPSVRHRWVRQYFGHEVLVPQKGPRFGLRPHHAARLRELSIAAVEEIGGREYHVAGDLAELIPPEEIPVTAHPDDVTESEMLEVAGKAIVQMVDDVRRLTHQRNRLRRELHGVRRSLPRRALSRVRDRTARWRRGNGARH